MAILTAPPTSLALLDGANGFRLAGAAAGDFSGRSVSGAGDVNGDGFGDLIVAAPQSFAFGSSVSGDAYVVFGKAGGFAPSVNLSALNGADHGHGGGQTGSLGLSLSSPSNLSKQVRPLQIALN